MIRKPSAWPPFNCQSITLPSLLNLILIVGFCVYIVLLNFHWINRNELQQPQFIADHDVFVLFSNLKSLAIWFSRLFIIIPEKDSSLSFKKSLTKVDKSPSPSSKLHPSSPNSSDKCQACGGQETSPECELKIFLNNFWE